MPFCHCHSEPDGFFWNLKMFSEVQYPLLFQRSKCVVLGPGKVQRVSLLIHNSVSNEYSYNEGTMCLDLIN